MTAAKTIRTAAAYAVGFTASYFLADHVRFVVVFSYLLNNGLPYGEAAATQLVNTTWWWSFFIVGVLLSGPSLDIFQFANAVEHAFDKADEERVIEEDHQSAQRNYLANTGTISGAQRFGALRNSHQGGNQWDAEYCFG